MRRKVSLINWISRVLNGTELTMEERELQKIALEQKDSAGINAFRSAKNVISIPSSYRSEEEEWLEERYTKRGLETQGYLIQSENSYLINPVSDLSVFIKAGALFLTNQINTIKVSSLSGILASWIDDGEEVEVDGATINPTGATFEGKRLYAQLNVPRRMIEQGGPEFDAYLRSCITAALADKLDATLGGVLASGTYKPQGMGYAITSGMTSKEAAISPDYQDIVNLESSLNDINFPVRDLAFITNARGRGILRNVTNPGGDPIFKDGKLLDYLAYVSNYISSHAGANSDGNLLLWGCWKDLAILQFGGYDIIVDPFTLKKQAKVQLNINAYFDFKGLRGSSPTSPDGSTEANNYAFSFSSLAIK